MAQGGVSRPLLPSSSVGVVISNLLLGTPRLPSPPPPPLPPPPFVVPLAAPAATPAPAPAPGGFAMNTTRTAYVVPWGRPTSDTVCSTTSPPPLLTRTPLPRPRLRLPPPPSPSPPSPSPPSPSLGGDVVPWDFEFEFECEVVATGSRCATVHVLSPNLCSSTTASEALDGDDVEEVEDAETSPEDDDGAETVHVSRTWSNEMASTVRLVGRGGCHCAGGVYSHHK